MRFFVGAALLVTAQTFTLTQNDGPTKCAEEDMIKKGDHVSMHYNLSIDESSKSGKAGLTLDSTTWPKRQILTKKIGVGLMIPALDKGLIGVCKDANVTLIAPPEEAYGEKGVGGVSNQGVPPGATVKFDIKVVFVQDLPEPPSLFAEMDLDNDHKLTPDEIVKGLQRSDPSVTLASIETLLIHEDKNQDGFVSWDEFTMGPKGHTPPWANKDEL